MAESWTRKCLYSIRYVMILIAAIWPCVQFYRTEVPFDNVVEAQREMIADDLAGAPLANDVALDDLLLDRGGQPRRTLIVTHWHSGDAALVSLLTSQPAMYYHHEPLAHLGVRRVSARDEAGDEAVDSLYAMLQCNYTQLDDYFSEMAKSPYQLQQNARLWWHCKDNPNIYLQPAFVSTSCRQYPFQTMKTIRLPLSLVPQLMQRFPALRVVYMARDPRGTFQAQKPSAWCHNQPDCDDIKLLCQDLEDDFWAMQELVFGELSSRLKVVRYEDLASTSLEELTARLLSHAELDHSSPVQSSIASQSAIDQESVVDAWRNLPLEPFLWIRTTPWTRIKEIQDHCRSTLELWGYWTIGKEQWETLRKLSDEDLIKQQAEFINMRFLENVPG